MLSTLHATEGLAVPVYGMNRGTVGFLMNEYAEAGLLERLDAAEAAVLNPLRMRATRADGEVIEALAINEVSILRPGRRRRSCASWSTAASGWRSWWRTARCSARRRDRPPTTIRRMGRSCRSGPRSWR